MYTGQFIGKVQAVDRDRDDTNGLRYTLSEPSAYISVNESSGSLLLNAHYPEESLSAVVMVTINL